MQSNPSSLMRLMPSIDDRDLELSGMPAVPKIRPFFMSFA